MIDGDGVQRIKYSKRYSELRQNLRRPQKKRGEVRIRLLISTIAWLSFLLLPIKAVTQDALVVLLNHCSAVLRVESHLY